MTANRTRLILATTVLAMSLAFPFAASAEDVKSLEALAAESASTPEQHLSLAAYYRGKAEEERAEVKRHRMMATSYSSRSAGAEAGMKSHCDRLAEAADKAATEYEALAAEHEAAAKTATK